MNRLFLRDFAGRGRSSFAFTRARRKPIGSTPRNARRGAGTLLILIVVLTLVAGCSATWTATPRLPSNATLVRDQLVIHTDFALPHSHRLVEELVALRTDIARVLGTRLSDEPIHVFLFQRREEYEQFIQARFPELPPRRAWFVETDTQLAVFAHWGHHVADDLRHEAAHGYLHSSTPNVPLWLDEGLAEYFETPRSRQGLNRPHLDHLVRLYDRGQWTPDLRRLEAITEASELTQSDYAECWAWTRFMLDTLPQRRAMLRGYLAELRASGKAPPISQVLGSVDPGAGEAMLAHLMELAAETR